MRIRQTALIVTPVVCRVGIPTSQTAAVAFAMENFFDVGLPTVGFADCNDPGLFVSEAQGQLDVAVPLDDNVTPGLYEPLIDYVLGRAGLPRA